MIKTVLIVFSFVSILAAAVPDTTTKQEYLTLVNKIEQIEGMENVRNGNLENHKKDLDIKYENFVIDVKRDKQELDFWLKLIAGGGIIALISTIIVLAVYAKKIAKETLDNAFNNKSKEIEALISMHLEDYQLKTKKKILVITPAYSNNEFLTLLFKKTGFNIGNIHYEPMHETIPNGNYDLVLFNDENGKALQSDTGYNGEKKLIEEYLHKFPKGTVRFYFGPKKVEPNAEDRNSTAFTNAHMQLYGNLLNALRYQDICV